MNNRGIVFLFSIIIVTGFGQNKNDATNVKTRKEINSNERSSKFVYSGVPELIINSHSILRSTLSISGCSNTITIQEKQFNVSHSIGQASLIGTYVKSGYTLLQGYQQALVSIEMIRNPADNSLEATVLPNPFHQDVNISFHDQVTKEILIHLSDILGKTIISEKFPASQLITLNLDSIKSGIYILNVKVGNKHFVAKLTKQ